jgi:hypothetical protein
MISYRVRPLAWIAILLAVGACFSVYLVAPTTRCVRATSPIDSPTDQKSSPSAVLDGAQSANRSVEQMCQLKDELAQAAQSGDATAFGPFLNRVVASVPSEPSRQFDQVIEQLIRFAQRGRRLSDEQHRSFPAESVRRLLPIYEPHDWLLTVSLVGQFPGDPLDDRTDWSETRQADLELSLRVWARAKNKVDSNYDPNAPENAYRRFSELPVPDPLARYEPETQLKDIKEPDIREAYERSIARNRATNEKRSEQADARKLEEELHKHVEKYLPYAFGYPPDKIDTIAETLAKYDFHTDKLGEIQATAHRDLAIVMKARERDAANQKLLDELRATGRLKD